MQTQPAVRLWCLGWSWACSGQGVNCAGTTWESHRALTVGAVPGPSHVGSLDLRAGGGGSSSRSSSLQQPSSSTQSESSSSQQWPSKSARRTWPAPRTYILLFRFLYKEGFPVVTQLHVEIHSVAIDLYVNLGADTVRLSSERPSSQLNKAQTPSSLTNILWWILCWNCVCKSLALCLWNFEMKIKLDLPWKFILERKEETAAPYESVFFFLKVIGCFSVYWSPSVIIKIPYIALSSSEFIHFYHLIYVFLQISNRV